MSSSYRPDGVEDVVAFEHLVPQGAELPEHAAARDAPALGLLDDRAAPQEQEAQPVAEVLLLVLRGGGGAGPGPLRGHQERDGLAGELAEERVAESLHRDRLRRAEGVYSISSSDETLLASDELIYKRGRPASESHSLVTCRL